MENLENNKLIAEFMQSLEDGLYKDGLYFYEGGYYDTNMEFHTSWDWLMPVIERCLVGEAEQSEEVSNTAIKNIYEGICNQDIHFAYKSVVEFIKWYNKNNKQMEILRGYTDTELREELARRGYYTENLWTADDVNYYCSKEEALKVIDTVMQSEWLVSNIFEMIEETASDLYEPIEEELPE